VTTICFRDRDSSKDIANKEFRVQDKYRSSADRVAFALKDN